MKYLLFFLTAITYYPFRAQENKTRTVYVNENVSTHFICSEPVQYVDISTDRVVGDMPLVNIVRIRPKGTTADELGTVTIVAQQYMIQYHMIYTDAGNAIKEKRNYKDMPEYYDFGTREEKGVYDKNPL